MFKSLIMNLLSNLIIFLEKNHSALVFCPLAENVINKETPKDILNTNTEDLESNLHLKGLDINNENEATTNFMNQERLDSNLTININELLTLNGELETAVDVLKSEIWSLNNELEKVFFNLFYEMI